MKYIIPLEGDGSVSNPFRPAFLKEAPPAIHYDLPNNVAIFDPDEAIKTIDELAKKMPKEVRDNFLKVMGKKIKDAANTLSKLAEEGKVKIVE